MPIISLYWFAVQQKTSILRSQKQSLFESKFSVKSNGYVPSFYKEREVA